MQTAAVYCRISQDDGTALGVTRQRKDCLALVERKGWTLGDVYLDNDVSAFSGKNRPEYERMFDDVKNGLVDVVVAWHPDRLHRSPRDLEDFIDLIESTGATVATCTAGDYDLSTPDGRLMARIVGSVARKESEDKSRRLRRKHLELAEAGMVSGGGNRPFGFERDRMTVRPDEADLLRDAARRVLAGDSLYAIVADWAAQDVETSTGVPWSTTSLKSTLVRPRIAGLREHRGAVVGEAVWPAILDRSTWEQVRAILTDPARRRNPVVRSYLLTGLLRCALCGKPMVAAPRAGKTKGDSVRAYGCVKTSGGCGRVYGLAEPIEEHTVAAVLVALDSPEMAKALRADDDPTEGETAAIAADEAKMIEYAEMYDAGEITRAEWKALRDRVEGRLETSRKRLGRRQANVLDGLLDAPGGLAAAWDALSLDRRRAVISVVLESVSLGPATGVRNRWNPERLSFTWRV